MAKEKDCSVWKKKSFARGPNTRSARAPVPSTAWATSRSAAAYATPTRPHRARSTSPPSQTLRYPFTFTYATQPTLRPANDQPSKSRTKRSAEDAFSPTSTSFPPVKAARRNTPALSLSIPVSVPQSSSPAVNRGVKSGSPLDNLSFSKLSLASNSPAVASSIQNAESDERMWVSSSGQHVPPKMLSAAWPLQERERTWAAPQVRSSLACPPLCPGFQHHFCRTCITTRSPVPPPRFEISRPPSSNERRSLWPEKPSSATTLLLRALHLR